MIVSASSKPLTEIPCQYLKGVGPKLAQRLEKLGINTAQEVLFHLPLRYEDRSRLVPISQLHPSMQALTEGTILSTQVVKHGRLSLQCLIHDERAQLVLRFFHFSQKQRELLTPGKKVRCFGEVRMSKQGLTMIHPEYRIFIGESPPISECLTPIYPTTEGVSQHVWQQMVAQVLALLHRDEQLQDLLPESVLQPLGFPSLKQALFLLHQPPKSAKSAEWLEAKNPCLQRLVFEELLAHQLSLRGLRAAQQQHRAPPLPSSRRLVLQFLQQFPFQLTRAQQRVAKEISDDLQRPKPMLRLVQGDVGSGKTVVAVLAALQAVEQGWQVAVMAPTELLAEQHFNNFNEWLTPLNIQLSWLSSQVKGKQRIETLANLFEGKTQIIIGTHALFQEEVIFHRLGLVIIDEQHRFGVHQRLALKEKGRRLNYAPHQLIMTATPIPRTLAMCAYADLDQSVIDELPPGRKPVTTVVINDHRREEIIERIREVCREGRQVYWVCTLIEESEVLQCQAAEKAFVELALHLEGLRVALVHGRLKAKEKESIMAEFKQGNCDVLVATTVIEVGVDVPNASLMIIENSERLGLAQLHQLRGRVGRGALQSHCVLLYRAPLSGNGRERLKIMKNTSDGFLIAQHDLELRGPGEVLGTKQKGEMSFRLANLIRDQSLLPIVQHVSKILEDQYPQSIPAIIHRWIGAAHQYRHV